VVGRVLSSIDSGTPLRVSFGSLATALKAGQLQRLVLQHVNVEVAEQLSLAQHLPVLSALTSLSIYRGQVPHFVLEGLPSLKALHELVLVQPGLPASELAGLELLEALQQLPRLTRLRFSLEHSSSALLGNLQGLTGLQSLELSKCGISPAVYVGVACMPHLTCLELVDLPHLVFSTSPAAFSALTSLKRLLLVNLASIQPAALRSISAAGMQQLVLSGTRVGSKVADAECLLAWISSMTGLQHLHLSRALQHCLPLTAAGRYQGLTASRQLRSLVLRKCKCCLKQAWHQAFSSPCYALVHLEVSEITAPAGNKLTTTSLGRLAASCPGLQQLCLGGALEPAASLTALQPLQQCQARLWLAPDWL